MTTHMILTIAANAVLDAGVIALVVGMVRFGTRPDRAQPVPVRPEPAMRAAA